MDLQIINTEKEYHDLLNWVDEQFDLSLNPDSKEGQKLQIALLLIKNMKIYIILSLFLAH